MNEILFKAKSVDGKRWVEGYYFARPLLEKHFILCDSAQWQVDRDTLCRRIGMHASWDDPEYKSKESDVWEHDLLEVDYDGKRIVAEVKFECGMFILASNEFTDSYIPLLDFVEHDGDNRWIDAKVIGNAFDNPELINGMKDPELEREE